MGQCWAIHCTSGLGAVGQRLALRTALVARRSAQRRQPTCPSAACLLQDTGQPGGGQPALESAVRGLEREWAAHLPVDCRSPL